MNQVMHGQTHRKWRTHQRTFQKITALISGAKQGFHDFWGQHIVWSVQALSVHFPNVLICNARRLVRSTCDACLQHNLANSVAPIGRLR
jgi:hypothetical protein